VRAFLRAVLSPRQPLCSLPPSRIFLLLDVQLLLAGGPQQQPRWPALDCGLAEGDDVHAVRRIDAVLSDQGFAVRGVASWEWRASAHCPSPPPPQGRYRGRRGSGRCERSCPGRMYMYIFTSTSCFLLLALSADASSNPLGTRALAMAHWPCPQTPDPGGWDDPAPRNPQSHTLRSATGATRNINTNTRHKPLA
jgi:hypothetical protein